MCQPSSPQALKAQPAIVRHHPVLVYQGSVIGSLVLLQLLSVLFHKRWPLPIDFIVVLKINRSSEAVPNSPDLVVEVPEQLVLVLPASHQPMPSRPAQF